MGTCVFSRNYSLVSALASRSILWQVANPKIDKPNPGRVIRDMHRKLLQPDLAMETLLKTCERLRSQQLSDKNKIYSLHEPEEKCIGKGKSRQRYDFARK